MDNFSHIDKKKIESAARKGLMAADAHYHAWPKEQQERFRATMSETSRNRIQQVLLDSLLGIKCSVNEVDKVWNDVPLSKLNILNWASLLTSGIGEDYIYLNESMAKGKSLLDFPTLYDYDYADYLFQEQANRRDCSDNQAAEYKGSDYYACKHPSWVRLLIQDEFYYATFLSAATHLVDELGSAGSDFINQLIPHEYVDGKEHGKQEKGGFLWDMQVDADGQEGQLDELRSRWYSYQQERWLELSKSNDRLTPVVYTHDKNWDDDPHRFFIFSNASALRQIRWQHFLSDCEPLAGEFSVMEELIESEINQAKSYIAKSHQDIMKNFDPNVVKFRKKTKVVMSAEALEDISRIDSSEEPSE